MERQLEREADSCDTKSMYSSSGLDENGDVIEEWNYLNRFFKKFNKVGTNFTNSTHKWSSIVGLKSLSALAIHVSSLEFHTHWPL